MIISSILGIVALVCYTISQLWLQGKLIWRDDKEWDSFWGSHAYERKYAHYPNNVPPNNWYYKFFEIPHKERFPGSATVFVWLTDGYHLSQFIMINCVCSIIAILTTWWMFLVIRLTWWLVFNLTYKFLGND